MKDAVKNLLRPTYFKRFLFFFLCDILMITLSLYLSFLIRFEFVLPEKYYRTYIHALPIFLGIKLPIFALFRMYKITWRYVGINDFLNIVNAVLVSELILLVLIWIPLPSFLTFQIPSSLIGFPRSIFLIDGSLCLILLSGIRISKRVVLEIVLKKQGKEKKRTIIVGAGNTGEMILRDILKQKFSEFYPVALVDDDKNKLGAYLHGVKVVGTTDELSKIIKKYNAQAVIIAIPQLNHKKLKDIYNIAVKSDVNTIKIVPRIYSCNKPEINIKTLEEIKIEDLIGRETVNIDFDEIEKFLRGKAVLITGAAGSIGSEIVRQVCSFSPNRLILFEIDETELYNFELSLEKMYPYLKGKIHYIVGDIRDEIRIEEVFKAYRPQIIFHAAAYKHVPIMEFNPQEAVKVNIFGTYNLASVSVKYDAEKFILISTDKAVKPTSVMGATKRVSEYICSAFNDSGGKTKFVSVRFGNVLGSRGSVLSIFMEQLKNGGPLTITHRDMKRYFMTIPEAVSLVLQASVMGKGGEVMVLDMGKPVRILELAEELIRLNGLEPYKDIEIKFTGIRPGERLFEEILTAEEGTIATKHERIFISKNSKAMNRESVLKMIDEFKAVINTLEINKSEKIKALLKKYVKDYASIEA